MSNNLESSSEATPYVRTMIFRTMEAMDNRELTKKETYQEGSITKDSQLSNKAISIKATPKTTRNIITARPTTKVADIGALTVTVGPNNYANAYAASSVLCVRPYFDWYLTPYN